MSKDFNSDNLISDLGLELRDVFLVFINISAPGPKFTDFLGEELSEGKLLNLIVPGSFKLDTDNFGELEIDPKLIISGSVIMIK
jgi:hypothetical protein|tara:strand:- start:260 stop:511 length:252 start_codon:yes stop_codon:yes gene_type:complete